MALLAALVAVVAAVTTLTIALATLQEAKAAHHAETVRAWLDQGREAGEGLALAWLARNGETVVLPPGNAITGLTIVHDRLSIEGLDLTVQVVLHDGLGGVPLRHAVLGAPLRLALPSTLSNIHIPAAAKVGGEAFPGDSLERARLPTGVRRFPSAPMERPGASWHEAGGPRPPQPAGPAGLVPISPPVALGTAIAFHSDGRININTAPNRLLAVAFQGLGRGGLDTVLEARRLGRFSSMASLPPPGSPGSEAAPDGPVLVDRSDRWQALVTVECQGRRLSWWTVIAGTGGDQRIMARHAVQP